LPGSENSPQTLLFSATCPRWVYDVAKKYMKGEYEQVALIGKKTQRTATTVEVSDSSAGLYGSRKHIAWVKWVPHWLSHRGTGITFPLIDT